MTRAFCEACGDYGSCGWCDGTEAPIGVRVLCEHCGLSEPIYCEACGGSGVCQGCNGGWAFIYEKGLDAWSDRMDELDQVETGEAS